MGQLRMGMIGVGGRGVIAAHWHQPNGRSVVVAGADVSDEALAKFKTDINPQAFTTRDYRELLARKDIDAVAVTSPDFCHEEHAVAALEAGKHVFCEKPLAITTAGCDRILAAWKKSGKRLMVGFNMRYMSIYRTMKEIADSGILGEIKAVWMRHFVGEGGNYYFHDWHAKRANTTSLLLQKGSHDIDMIHWITGRYTKRVIGIGGRDYFGGDMPNDLTCPNCDRKRICPDVQPPENPRQQCCFRKEVDVEDNSLILMEMEGGVKATYLQCHFTPEYQRSYVFIGTLGRMESFDLENKVVVRTRRSMTLRDYADRTYNVKEAAGTHGGADPVICEDFLEMVIDGREPVATPVAGRMSVAVGCAGAESIRKGGVPVEVPSLPKGVRSAH